MRNLKRFIACIMFVAIFAGGFLFTTPTVALAATTSKADDTDNLKSWFKVCSNVGMTLKKRGFRYSNSGCKNTLAKAVKSGRKCNCALYVSWCLQEYGAIPKGKTFHVKESGRLNKSLGKGVRVIRVYKSAKNAHLKPGDVVCFTTPHICIYAGKNKKGKNVWFDQGKIATYGNSDGARYKSYGYREEGYLNNRTVSYIVRIKSI